jgi:hypothetical protein
MANLVEKQILEEGPRNAMVKVAMVLDTANVNLVSYIKPSDFTNNDTRQVLTGFRVDEVLYSTGQVIDVVVSWNGATPQLIVPLARSGKIDLWMDGGAIPDTTRDGYDGSINISTSGFPAGTVQNVTLNLRMVKLYRAITF